MNRTLLCRAIEGLVTRCGYDFHQHDKSHYPSTLSRYPAAFLSTPKFVAIEGRKHGRITYNISLIVAQQGAKLAPADRNDIYARMEEQLVDIFVELSKEGLVALVDNLTISPSAEAVDHHGAIALEARADIETIF
jgi:hypothetical protein